MVFQGIQGKNKSVEKFPLASPLPHVATRKCQKPQIRPSVIPVSRGLSFFSSSGVAKKLQPISSNVPAAAPYPKPSTRRETLPSVVAVVRIAGLYSSAEMRMDKTQRTKLITAGAKKKRARSDGFQIILSRKCRRVPFMPYLIKLNNIPEILGPNKVAATTIGNWSSV